METSIGTRLRELRGPQSQTTFSRKIGIKQTTYCAWESDRKIPAANAIGKVCSTLGVSSDWLLGISQEKNGKINLVPDPTLSAKIAELETEITRLKGENAGLRHALEVVTHIKK